MNCHSIDGKGNAKGPLDGVGLKYSADELRQWLVDPVTIDLRNFSLHPWNAPRLLLLGGILTLHIAVLWAAALTLTAAPARWRLPRRFGRPAILVLLAWILPSAMVAAAGIARSWPFSAAGLLLSATACAIAAIVGRRVAPWYRHATVAARILTLFLAFLIPSLLLYPSVHFFARRATERLITTRFAVEAQQFPQAIQQRMTEARAETEAALGVLRQLGACREMARAEKMLERLDPDRPSGHVGARTGPLGALSRREVEVLALVAEGLTNHEIAERLVLSEHTVHRHVTNILRKLSLSSRAAAASLATRHGLA